MTEEELDTPATKRDLIGLASKAELAEAIGNAIAPLATKQELVDGLTSLMQAILTVQSEVLGMREELRISIGITQEEWARRVGVVDDKYRDLPGPRLPSGRR